MQTQGKILVYLQRLNLKNTAAATACNVSRFGLLFCPMRRRYTAVCYPRNVSIMGILTAVCVGLDSGKGHTAFLVPSSKLNTHTK